MGFDIQQHTQIIRDFFFCDLTKQKEYQRQQQQLEETCFLLFKFKFHNFGCLKRKVYFFCVQTISLVSSSLDNRAKKCVDMEKKKHIWDVWMENS